MKLTRLVSIPALAVLVGAGAVIAGSKPGAENRMAPEFAMPDMSPEGQAKMMQEYLALMQPGEEHELLGYLIGDWTSATKMWMEGPGKPATESTGEASIEAILGGRFVRQQWAGEFMGMPLTGEGTLGFDQYAGRYQFVWISSMSTAMIVTTGFAHPDGKGMTLHGKVDEPGMDMRGKIIQYIFRVIDEDSFRFEVHDLHIGRPNTRVVEVTYTRAE